MRSTGICASFARGVSRHPAGAAQGAVPTLSLSVPPLLGHWLSLAARAPLERNDMPDAQVAGPARRSHSRFDRATCAIARTKRYGHAICGCRNRTQRICRDLCLDSSGGSAERGERRRARPRRSGSEPPAERASRCTRRWERERHLKSRLLRASTGRHSRLPERSSVFFQN
jgi:hypothetical protein